LAIYNVDGAVHAIDGTCTHRGGPLGEGELTGNVVTCPWHGARFDVTTGAVLGPPASKEVASYRVTVEGDSIFVELA
jgi:nitrite reductase/ring-hydroxylating ferredoxin subunit